MLSVNEILYDIEMTIFTGMMKRYSTPSTPTITGEKNLTVASYIHIMFIL